jgi:glutamyl-tRNA(Gln) amidotransferase subunit E
MRPTLSELGEYDGTALMEFKTKKEIIYRIDDQTVCTYEMDDTPPFELNEQALDIALEITMLLNCKLVSEVHIARKQYLDGSIPTGFQRTTILGVDGWIPYGGRKIGIIQLGLEEDACREISDSGHMRVYRTDRLGIPLIETVTQPEMKTPQEVAEVAQILRYLARSSGKVRTGIGAARQDVNVSVEGGRRVEIKGVPRIPAIPLLVHTEAYRQRALLDIKEELERRGITEDNFECRGTDVTDIVRNTRYYPAAKALKNDARVRAVNIKGYRGILSTKTQPETSFAKEISDRVRVIACLDILPNIAHSDMEGETFSSAEWSKIKSKVGCGDRDVVVVVWGGPEDVETAAREIEIRVREALDGVPNETRQALPDGTNGFERILPGPDRMYPDTDLPPLAITEDRIERIREGLPSPPWELEESFLEDGIREDIAKRLSISGDRDLYLAVSDKTSFDKSALAFFILDKLGRMREKGGLAGLTADIFYAALAEMENRKLPLSLAGRVLAKACAADPPDPEGAAARFISEAEGETRSSIEKYLGSIEMPAIPGEKLREYLTGMVLEHMENKLPGEAAASIVDEYVSSIGAGRNGEE